MTFFARWMLELLGRNSYVVRKREERKLVPGDHFMGNGHESNTLLYPSGILVYKIKQKPEHGFEKDNI